jgi:hypothetical protein
VPVDPERIREFTSRSIWLRVFRSIHVTFTSTERFYGLECSSDCECIAMLQTRSMMTHAPMALTRHSVPILLQEQKSRSKPADGDGGYAEETGCAPTFSAYVRRFQLPTADRTLTLAPDWL